MPTLIITTNASQATPVTIPDMGVIIPDSGGSDTFTDSQDLEDARLSGDLRALATDDAFGAGSSTLILNDGTVNIDQDDIDEFLERINVSVVTSVDTSDPAVTDDETRGFQENSLWINTTTDQGFLNVDPASGAAIWKQITNDTLDDTEVFSGYTNSNSSSFTTTWTDMPIDAEFKKSSSFTHTNPNPNVTIGETGTYLVIAEITIDQVSGNSRSTAEMRLVVDTGGGYNEIDGTRARMYSRNNAQGEQVGSVSIIRDFTAGDQIKAQAQRFSGAGSFQILADNSRLSILNLKGPKGDQGDPGSGSSVIIKEEGLSLGSFTDLNFIGSAITATDAGSGQANITVVTPTPIFGQNFATVSSTTVTTVGGTAWTQYLSLSTGSIPAGTYRIGWFYIWNSTSVSSDVEVRVQLDNTINVMLAVEEAVDAFGSGPGGTNQRFPRGGSWCGTLGPTGSHTFDLDFRQNDASDDATILQAQLEFWRVS